MNRSCETSGDIFTFVYSEPKDNIEYSVAIVPENVDFKISYTNPPTAADITFTPAGDKWDVRGFADIHTIHCLGFPVSGRIVEAVYEMYVSEAQYKQISESGTCEPFDETFFDIRGLLIESAHLQDFLKYHWVPHHIGERKIELPQFQLDLQDTGYRIVPQKRYLRKSEDKSNIFVIKW